MTLTQLSDIVRARWGWVALTCALTAALAAGASMSLPRTYTASTQLLVDAKGPDAMLGAPMAAQAAAGYMATQVDILTSQRVALKVVDALKLAEGMRAAEQWREATGGVGSIRHHYSDLLLKGVGVKPSRESSVIAVSYTAADPRLAASVANAFAQAYLDLNVELRVEPAKQVRGLLDAQTEALRDKLESSQRRLAAYQRDKGADASQERFDTESARFAELSARIAALQAPREGANASARPDPNQRSRETELRAALDKQRARVVQLEEARDELAVLQREARLAERAFDAASERLAQNALDTQASPPRVVVLTPAVEPREPSSPDALRVAALGAGLGLLLGMGVALVLESRDRRVRGPQDLKLASGLPPMGVLRDAFAGGRARRAGPSIGGRAAPALAARAAGPANVAGGAVAAGAVEGAKDGPDASLDADPRASGAHGRADDAAPFPDTVIGASPDDAPQADAGRRARPGGHQPIGQILVSAGLINPPEVERILAWARADGTRFGEAAVAHKVVSESQMARALAYQFDYPVLDPADTRVSPEVVAAFDARNPLVADLRRLRAKIRGAQIASAPDAPLKAFAVISSGTGDGKTFVAANLAVTFAQMGQRTLLIDADLRHGRLHEVFGVANRTGLSSMLNRCIEPGALQRVPGLGNLSVVSCGPLAPNPSELLSRDVFAHLLASFARAYDVIILDTPGAAEEPDATLVAQRAGAALVLARKDRSSFDAVVELVQSGGTPDIPVLGSVLNAA